jgi:hypothetical protein
MGVVLMLGLALNTSCGDTDTTNGGESERAGTLSIPLVTTGASGIVYGIRDARFEIVRSPGGSPEDFVEFIDTEPFDPTRQSFERLLPNGKYIVDLHPGWRIVQSNDGVNFTDIEAELISPSTVPVTVVFNETVEAVYQFRVNGEDIIFGDGTLRIRFEVEEGFGGAGGAAGAGGGVVVP